MISPSFDDNESFDLSAMTVSLLFILELSTLNRVEMKSLAALQVKFLVITSVELFMCLIVQS